MAAIKMPFAIASSRKGFPIFTLHAVSFNSQTEPDVATPVRTLIEAADDLAARAHDTE
jgi:hypothetical protein